MNRQWSLDLNFNFSYTIDSFDTITTIDYLDAIDKTVKDIKTEMDTLGLSKVGLCLSGSDSELIAHFLNKNSIPTEYFFMDIDGINFECLELCEKISERYATPLNVISITKQQLLSEEIYKNFNITPVCMPTYVTIPSLIERIPNDFYVIVGEGDLEKDSEIRYPKMYSNKNINYNSDNFYIPIHLTETAYARTLSYYNKHWETNFYSRKFDTWYHILKDNRLITNGKYFYDPKTNIMSDLIKKQSLFSPSKSVNYPDATQYNLKVEIYTNLAKYGKQLNGWTHVIGDFVTVPKSLLI